MKQDYNGVRTAQDLERKYDFTQLETAKEINNNIIQANKNLLISNMNNELKLFVEAVTKYIEDYSVDGNITTYYFSGVPSLNNNPAVEWTTDTEKNNHIWDLYYDKETGYVYMFKNENGTYFWERLEDYDVEKALALANAMGDTKDNKRQVFFTQPSPPYSNGDIWIDNEEAYICQISKPEGETYESADFIISSKYVDNTVAIKANNKFTVLAGSVLEIENNVDSYSRTLTQTIKVVDEQGNYIGDRSQKTTSLTQDVEGINLSIGSWDASQGSLSQQTANLRADVSAIRGEIGDITDITITKDGIGTLNFNGDDESINESNPVYMQIYPTTEDLSKIYPSSGLYPSSTLYPISNITIDFYNQTEDEHIYYTFPSDLRRLNDTYDEFIYDYDNNVCKIIRRISVDEYNVKSILATPVEEPIEPPDVYLTSGKYVITFMPFNTAYMKIRLMSQNMYTAQFATKVELNNKIEVTADHFTSELTKKVGNDEVISRINQTAEQITIDASKVNISGVITAINNNTTTTIDGNKITTGTLSASQITTGTLNGSLVNVTNINADNITTGTLSASRIASGSITGDKIAANTITAAKVASDIITTTNFSAQSINANNITSGTINSARLDASVITTSNFSSQTINADRITVGTLKAVDIYLGNGKFSVNTNGYLNATNGYFGGWNLGTGGLSNGHSALSSNGEISLYPTTGGVYRIADGAVRFNANGGIVLATSSNGNVYAGYGNLDLKACSGYDVYMGCMSGSNGVGERSSVTCKNGELWLKSAGPIYANKQIVISSSSKATKKNIKNLSQKQKNELYKLIKNIPFKQYDYKKQYGKKFNYGFLIEDIETTKLKQLLHIEQMDIDKKIKNYSTEDLARLELIVIQELMNKIEKLEEKING